MGHFMAFSDYFLPDVIGKLTRNMRAQFMKVIKIGMYPTGCNLENISLLERARETTWSKVSCLGK